MKKILTLLVLTSILTSTATAKEPVKTFVKGFADVQVDMSFSTSAMQEKDRSFGVLPEKDAEEFYLHIRNTQIGVMGGKYFDDGSSLTGYFSNYYYGRINGVYGSTTGPIPRAYAAFIKYSKNNKEYVIGQSKDVFSPLKPYGANPSAYLAINTGYLRPSISFFTKNNNSTFEWAVSQPTSFQTTAIPGITDDLDSEAHKIPVPDIQLRVSKNNAGLSAVSGKRKDSSGKYYDTIGICIDYTKKTGNKNISFEYFSGKALSGYFGGIATLDVIGNNEIESNGFWINYVRDIDKSDKLSIAYGIQSNDDKYIPNAFVVGTTTVAFPKENEIAFISYEKTLSDSGIKIIHEISYHNSEWKGLGEFDAVRAALSWKTSF
jgi:hypothetical protein